MLILDVKRVWQRKFLFIYFIQHTWKIARLTFYRFKNLKKKYLLFFFKTVIFVVVFFLAPNMINSEIGYNSWTAAYFMLKTSSSMTTIKKGNVGKMLENNLNSEKTL